MRNLAEMGLLKNRSAFICRPTPEEALKWGDSLDKLLAHKCKLLSTFSNLKKTKKNNSYLGNVFIFKNEFFYFGNSFYLLRICEVIKSNVFAEYIDIQCLQVAGGGWVDYTHTLCPSDCTKFSLITGDSLCVYRD